MNCHVDEEVLPLAELLPAAWVGAAVRCCVRVSMKVGVEPASASEGFATVVIWAEKLFLDHGQVLHSRTLLGL